MFYSQKDKVRRLLFKRSCKPILHTQPIESHGDSTTAVLTLLQHKDVLMFLVAIKSFARKIPLRNVYILNDGSLTEKDKLTLSSHIKPVEFLELSQVSNEHCPKGSCWERLLAIAARVADQYIVQLDADTVTLGAIDEVAKLIDDNQSFVIGTWDGQTIEPMQVSSERIQTNVNPQLDGHVQMVAEAAFDQLDECKNLKYVRGCAGFSGFAKGSFNTHFVEDFSLNMERLIGKKWNEWGSEQVMSNVVVANTPAAGVLPHPKYSDCANISQSETTFIHFVGSCRFQGKCYSNAVNHAITHLL